MEVSGRIAISGMVSYQRQLEVVSNNIANASTVGFKRSHASTTDTGYQAGLTAPVGPGGADVRIEGVGEGSQIADIRPDFLPGAAQPTGNALDLMLDGDGFFQVTLPNGQVGYTRDGAFQLDGAGRVVTAGGLPVRTAAGGDLVVPADAARIRVGEDGQLFAIQETGAGATEQAVGDFAVARFRNPEGLLANGQNLWTATGASGAAIATQPGAAGGPNVLGGMLEASNVEMADELTRLIQAQRGYQLNMSMVKTWDDIARMNNALLG